MANIETNGEKLMCLQQLTDSQDSSALSQNTPMMQEVKDKIKVYRRPHLNQINNQPWKIYNKLNYQASVNSSNLAYKFRNITNNSSQPQKILGKYSFYLKSQQSITRKALIAYEKYICIRFNLMIINYCPIYKT